MFLTVFPPPSERAIRSTKDAFFKLLYTLPSKNYEKIIKLVQNSVNNKEHSSLKNYTPIQVFHDDHVKSLIARENNKSFKNHQTQSRSIFSKIKNAEKLAVGDEVLLKLKKKPFQKEQSVLYKRWSEKHYFIAAVDKTEYPPLYSLRDFHIKNRRYRTVPSVRPSVRKTFFNLNKLCRIEPETTEKKYRNAKTATIKHILFRVYRFYAHELQKIGTYLEPPTSSKTVLVHDVIFSEEPILRSGKVLANKRTPSYQITRDGQPQNVTSSDLKFFKKIWGPNSLVYSDSFQTQEKRGFIV